MKKQELLEEQQETPTHRETEAPSASREREQQEQRGTTIIHVYVVDAPPAPLEEDQRTIESTLEAAEEEDNPQEESEPALPLTHALFTSSRRPGVPLLLLLVLCLLSTTAVVSGIVLVPVLTASASVTIIPASTQISSTTTLTLVTGTPHPHPGPPQVAGRLLATLTLRQEQVVPTTGVGHQQAQAARGTITLYNALPQAQIVPAGTLLVGADGVRVVTEEDASLPAGSLSTNGQVTVDAHALQVGPAGNIRANDIYGACCRADVFAQNSAAFHGGQKARDFPMVTRQDIDKAVTMLKASLQASVQAALHTQVQPGETLITPVPCTPKVAADHAVGDEAKQVTVRFDETCPGETYDTQAVQTFVTQSLTQEATRQFGAGYTLTVAVQVTGVTVTPSLVKEQHGALVLNVRGTGTWAYQFSTTEVHHMAQRIAGKSREQATILLLEQPGVSQVAMTVSGMEQTSLPTDASRIRFLVLSRPL